LSPNKIGGVGNFPTPFRLLMLVRIIMTSLTVRTIVPRRLGEEKITLNLELLEGKITVLAGTGARHSIARAFSGVDACYTVKIEINQHLNAGENPRRTFGRRCLALYPRCQIIPRLTADENLRLLCSRTKTRRRFEALWSQITNDAEFPAKTLATNLTYKARRVLEICRAAALRPRLFLLNDALYAFTDAEKHLILSVLRREKLTVLYTTSEGREILYGDLYCELDPDDVVSALMPVSETGIPEINQMLYGATPRPAPLKSGKPVLELLAAGTALFSPEIRFSLHEGEILGITGLEGQGLEDLGIFLSGRRRARKGVLTCGGESLSLPKIRRGKLQEKIGFVVTERDLAAAKKTGVDVFVFPDLVAGGGDAAPLFFYEEAQELASDGKGVIILTHNWTEVLHCANSIAVFSDGELSPSRPREKWTLADIAKLAEYGTVPDGKISLL
jgi:ABC-type sugar transport system ATPase subunit